MDGNSPFGGIMNFDVWKKRWDGEHHAREAEQAPIPSIEGQQELPDRL